MLVIGHRGACGLAPENTLQSMDVAIKAGASALEFDVRLTKDGVPVVIHDSSLLRTHHHDVLVSSITLKELRHLSASEAPVPTLQEVLKKYWGTVQVNIEVKERGMSAAVTRVVRQFCKTPADWEFCFFSSYLPKELQAIRTAAPHARLALLHKYNSFKFLYCHRQLQLSAVGWHNLYVNRIAIQLAKQLRLFTYIYTINQRQIAQKLIKQGIDGIITDYPDRLILLESKQKTHR